MFEDDDLSKTLKKITKKHKGSILISAGAVAIMAYIAKVIYNIITRASERKRQEQIEIAKRQAELRAQEQMNRDIYSHIDTLRKKYHQLAYKDDYGVIKLDKYKKEIGYFVDNVLCVDEYLDKENRKQRINYVLNYVLDNLGSLPQITSSNTNPYDFEHKCAETLNQSGWQAHATQASGDQGVDVIAEKDDKKIVIQCKLYSKPVGNKAVQEVYSGKDYYNADYAAVVSNQAYTASARQLAHKCGVLLLSFEDLTELDTFLK